MAEPSTADLVRAASTGDQAAWDAIVDRYSGLVWAVARAHRLGEADAADVFQTVWLRLVEHLGRIREPEHLGGWLSSTARHECLRMLRLGGRELASEDVDVRVETDPQRRAEPTPEQVFLASERRAEVLAAFARLPARCQSLLRLLVVDPQPHYAEISAALDMPVGSIGPTRGRCLAVLRTLLADSPVREAGA